jgi:hypothetical protein
MNFDLDRLIMLISPQTKDIYFLIPTCVLKPFRGLFHLPRGHDSPLHAGSGRNFNLGPDLD